MSAPLAGRQSPPPERQSGAQQQDIPGSGKTNVGKQPSPVLSSEEYRDNVMTSNPESRLEKIEAAKYANDKHHWDGISHLEGSCFWILDNDIMKNKLK